MTRARDLSKLLGTNSNGVIDNTNITLDAAEVPSLDTAKITTGTFASARLNNSSLSAITALPAGVGGSPMFKNFIINGDMRIDQRNAGASLSPTFNGEYCLDRYQNSLEQLNKYSVQQNAASVTPPAGFKNYLGVTSLTNLVDQNTAYYVISQHIEGENIRQLNWGTADAVSVNLSFYVRSSLTGQFGGSFRNSGTGGFRSYPFIYTINNANTWELKTITITGDTSGTWLNDTGIGMSVFFDIGCGSDNTGTANAWGTQNKLGATGSVRVVGTSGATWYITGLQLEAGTSATNFEHLPIEITRKRCYRYFQFYNLFHHTAIGGVFADTGGIWTPFWFFSNGEMRSTPTITYIDEVGNVGKVSTMNPNTANHFNTDNVSAFLNYVNYQRLAWNSYNTAYGIQNPHTGLLLVQNLKLHAEY